MARRTLSLLVLALFLAVPALAKRAKVPAQQPAAILAEPKDGAAKVVDVKKGDSLMVLGKQGDWSQVMTDGGKKGWVKSTVVAAGGLDSLDAASTQVAAAEGDTALAIRARPNPPRTVVVGVGGMTIDATRKVADLIKKDRSLKVLDVRTDKPRGNSPAGGLEGAKALAASKKADLVIALQPNPGEVIAYEIVDVKNGKILATGATDPTAADKRRPEEQLAAAVATATAELSKNPALEAKPAASPVVPVPTPATAR